MFGTALDVSSFIFWIISNGAIHRRRITSLILVLRDKQASSPPSDLFTSK